MCILIILSNKLYFHCINNTILYIYINFSRTSKLTPKQMYAFNVHVTVHRDRFLIIEPTRCIEQDQDVPFWSCSQDVSKPVWHIPSLCVQSKTPDDVERNCLKHVEFHSKIKFWEISASSWFYYKKCMFIVNYVLLHVLMKFWCKLPEVDDNAETCRS
jgi:hypothetical protein